MEFSADARALLEKPLLAVVATTRADGSPHSVPVWFRFDGEAIRVWSGGDYGWVKSARKRSRIAMTVCDTTDRFSGAVIIHGEASVGGGEDEATTREIHRIAGRYMPADAVAPYLQRYTHLRTIITITPTWITAWSSAE
jgi:PPOX class probable F420-dependent enzyme